MTHWLQLPAPTFTTTVTIMAISTTIATITLRTGRLITR